jgi:hypothetical protein
VAALLEAGTVSCTGIACRLYTLPTKTHPNYMMKCDILEILRAKVGNSLIGVHHEEIALITLSWHYSGQYPARGHSRQQDQPDLSGKKQGHGRFFCAEIVYRTN